jgi:hypothetical protein
MKKIISTIIIAILSFSSALSVPAQKKSGSAASNPVLQGAKLFASAAAYTDGNGVWIEWRTGIENEILGFHLYRLANGEKQLVSPVLIPGNLSPTGEKTTPGKSYNYFDPQGISGGVYVIESIDVNGYRQTSEQFYPQPVADLTERAGVSSQELQKRSAALNPNVQTENLNLPDDLKAETAQTNSAVPGDAATQKWVAAQPGAKIAVKQDGLYRVTRAELQNAGFDVNAPTTHWQLYADGIEQSINVAANGDYIEFYGRGVNTLQTDARIYYLVAGTQPGRRMAANFIRGISAKVGSANFSQSILKKDRVSYYNVILNGDAENFFGLPITTVSPSTTNFNLPDVDFGVPTATLRVSIQGFTFVAHQTKVILNGTQVGTFTGVNRDVMTATFTVPTSLLVSGSNTVQMMAMNPGGDTSFAQTVEVIYGRRYQAAQERLSFYTPNYRTTRVQGFNTPDIRVFDLTDVNNPSLVTGLQVAQQGLTYEVILPSARSRVLYAVAGGGLQTVASVTPNVPSTLSTPAHNANLIIISYKDWMTEANDWANYRRAEGLTVEVVNVEDVFDEFDFGFPTPDAVRNFLNYAKNNWQTPPTYVLLMGDATYDARNFISTGVNFIPAEIVDTTYMETGSDEALADFNDDGLAEIAVGRIPTRDAATVTTLLAKMTAFEQGLGSAPARGALCASDLPDGFDFAAMCGRVFQTLPQSIPRMFINRGDADARANLLNSINSGKYIVNYSGHGTFGAWAGNFFSRNDVPSMTNTNANQTIFIMLTCLNGYYVDAFSDGLAESLMKKPTGGAVSSWTSSGQTTPDIQEIMATRFYQQIGNSATMRRMGDFVVDAKSTIGGGRDVRLSWVLLGDPTMKVKP